MGAFMKNSNIRKKRDVKTKGKEMKDKPGSDACASEIEEMNDANPQRIDIQTKFLDQIGNLRYDRALEVGCGRSILTDLLL